ncbi:hypothetical protein WOLCODRAFT_136894 [Wolfiporia cocos MD-104 SS10]|uniref:Methyltransferase domain-containing protein n=1 Tax=Wolfiporia cocos (strain MD-104) TaxID=742152 RepID=A0A2H3JRS6_WOLCO|nr:hypothetical protein WOLCODRAFT_136894 [Wolfiporia cocos MD-104 SS10]
MSTEVLSAPVRVTDANHTELQDAHEPDFALESLTEEELAFLKGQTGIQDDNGLKEHITNIQSDAMVVHPYGCIRHFVFTKLKISRLPAYRQMMKLAKERQGAVFLDIGCCFGNDVRKAVADGFPAQNAIGSDLHPEFWQLGQRLFGILPEQDPVKFLPGDALNTAFLEAVAPFSSPPTSPRPEISSLTTLNPLRGHVSAIHASAFFHLFDEVGQLELARSLAGLLSPEPGSIIFGAHNGQAEKGVLKGPSLHITTKNMFCHSPGSWVAMWDGVVFEKGKVKANAFLFALKEEEVNLGQGNSDQFHQLVWSVVRL